MSGCTLSNAPTARGGGLQVAGAQSFLSCLPERTLALQRTPRTSGGWPRVAPLIVSQGTRLSKATRASHGLWHLWCRVREEEWHPRGWASCPWAKEMTRKQRRRPAPQAQRVPPIWRPRHQMNPT